MGRQRRLTHASIMGGRPGHQGTGRGGFTAISVALRLSQPASAEATWVRDIGLRRRKFKRDYVRILIAGYILNVYPIIDLNTFLYL